ncbi:facilitated trehalose transporter Tret1-2 homolog [Schistocerca americana]|uniref:facilitated trehalose transporter Tret1-2 homolog n=1 Tax=Schistocerca americana TaxID=7009 RepID=UPI001F4F6D20|nr:facilitated trehalose transporter Tret1-2 homolog [Schistocerca americana]
MSGHVLQEQNSRTELIIAADGKSAPQPASRLPQYAAAVIATAGALSAGTCMGYTSPALPLLQRETNPFPVSESAGSWVSALLNVGAALGALPAGCLAARVGPRSLIAALLLPFIASWMIIAHSDSVWELYVGRLVAGLAVGATSVAAPLYVTEVSETRVRGALGSLFQLQVTAGILAGYAAGLLADHRLLALALASLPAAFLLPALCWLPESPAYLLAAGSDRAARRALARLRGARYDYTDEIAELQDAVKAAKLRSSRVCDLWGSRAARRAMVCALGLMVFQQWSGVNAVIFYSQKIFNNAGASFMSPSTATIVIGVVQLAATAVSAALVDRLGRRALLLVSAAVMSACLGLLAAQVSGLLAVTWLPLAAVALFIVAFSLGFGPVPWLLLGELFTPDNKPTAAAVCATVNWLQAFTVTKVFVNMETALGLSGAFWVFTGSCAAAAAFVALLVPETRGRSLPEIQRRLAGLPDAMEAV